MRARILKLTGAAGVLLEVILLVSPAKLTIAQEGPVPSTNSAGHLALKTTWGEPDLQGIWTDESDTPLQRPAKYANQEYFTEAQRV